MTAHSRRDDPRVRLDALIDFYESQMTQAGARIPVAMPPAKLAKVLGRSPRNGCAAEFEYRGRTIVATGHDAAGMRFLGGMHD